MQWCTCVFSGKNHDRRVAGIKAWFKIDEWIWREWRLWKIVRERRDSGGGVMVDDGEGAVVVGCRGCGDDSAVVPYLRVKLTGTNVPEDDQHAVVATQSSRTHHIKQISIEATR